MPTDGDAGPASSERHTASIGNYTILGKLGEGGMGVVYEAKQENPRRNVALKVVRSQFVDELSVKMFQREAEILGRLKHPFIGAIYESGQTNEGQHFFAMELVRGQGLDLYVGESELPVNERLALFRAICDGVNYAHQRGVIHRDLKPSNILVGEDGSPKILDFGLARITDPDAAAVSMVSEVGAIKGTLAYMSPEQAQGNPDEIDLRTDVYTLGVILYQLLTGELPYDTGKGSILEGVRLITKQPPAPFLSLDPARRGSAGKLAGGELETITRKALEKSPDLRYQSAAAMADDIERHLTNQPILARPPSTIYQLKKLVVRNKLPFGFAATLVALLMGFGVWMSVLFTRADAARQESDAVTDFLSNMLAAVDPREQGHNVTVREVLDEGAKTISGAFADQPFVRARLMRTMGRTYSQLAHHDEAQPLLEQSIALLVEAHGPDHPDVAEGHVDLAQLLESAGDYERARSLYEGAVASLEESLGSNHFKVIWAQEQLARLMTEVGDHATALKIYEQSLAKKEHLYGSDHPEVATTLNDLAALLYFTGDYASAQSRYERALAIWEASHGPDHPLVATSLNNLANILGDIGQYAGAQPLYERALAILEESHGPDHPQLAALLNNLGDLRRELGDGDSAHAYHERALSIREKALGPDHPDVAMSLDNLSILLKSKGDYANALQLGERARTIWETSLGPDHARVATSLLNLGEILQAMGDYEGARPLFERTLAIDENTYGPEHEYVAEDSEALAALLRLLGEESEAETLEARAKAIRNKSESEE